MKIKNICKKDVFLRVIFRKSIKKFMILSGEILPLKKIDAMRWDKQDPIVPNILPEVVGKKTDERYD